MARTSPPARALGDGVVVAGSGPALVLIPGIQGRWEWMRPAVDALAARHRVITFSLAGERSAAARLGPAAAFDDHLAQVRRAMQVCEVSRAHVCGVSYGGLVAVRFAATHTEMVNRLVLVSAPAPTWRPDARLERYTSSPRASTPAFVLGAPGRLVTEIRAARDGWIDSGLTMARYLWMIAASPTSPVRMARRVKMLAGRDFVADARRITAPTLVITGNPELDRVVPVAGTREYLDLIPGSVGRTLERTGHIGLLTRTEEFAGMIGDFLTLNPAS